MRRLAAPLATLLAFSLVAAPAVAAERHAYSPAAMQSAQAEGKPVIVHVTASWCSTCAAQAPIVMQLMKDPKFKNLVVLNVDFDKQKAALRKLGVQAQSTFVAFKGKQEVGRSTGDTSKSSIENLFDKTS